ncbi:MAG: STAS domain-containing protein [Spirochaetes bacterium]|nr:STAS domain-containing protein [Spirochaetota bacterium]
MTFHIEVIKINFTAADARVDQRHTIFRVSPQGEMNMASLETYKALIFTLLDGGMERLMLDLSGLDYIDSAGIGVLVETAKRIRANKGEVTFINVSAKLQKIFDMVHLQTFIKVSQTEGHATNLLSFA